MLLPCGLLYMQRSAQSSGHCSRHVRKAAGRWAVNLEIERRCAAIAISLQFPWKGTAFLLDIQFSAREYCHQLQKAIKHEPLGAPPGRHEFVLVLFLYFWLGICCWLDTRLDESLVCMELFLHFYGLVSCHANFLCSGNHPRSDNWSHHLPYPPAHSFMHFSFNFKILGNFKNYFPFLFSHCPALLGVEYE